MAASPNPENVELRLQPATGLIEGRFVAPNTVRPARLRGVILPDRSLAVGQFLPGGTNPPGGFRLTLGYVTTLVVTAEFSRFHNDSGA